MPKRSVVIGGLLAAVVAVYVFSSTKTSAADSTPAPTASQCRVVVAADVLNVRSAPDSKADIVGKIKQGAQANADKVVTNGFRKVGDNRWVSAQFLKPVTGSNCG
jgi:uncharacterized protein YgiM (DUF1202 family)